MKVTITLRFNVLKFSKPAQGQQWLHSNKLQFTNSDWLKRFLLFCCIQMLTIPLRSQSDNTINPGKINCGFVGWLLVDSQNTPNLLFIGNSRLFLLKLLSQTPLHSGVSTAVEQKATESASCHTTVSTHWPGGMAWNKQTLPNRDNTINHCK